MLFFGAFEMSCVGSNEEETAIVFLSLVKIFILEARSYLYVDKPRSGGDSGLSPALRLHRSDPCRDEKNNKESI